MRHLAGAEHRPTLAPSARERLQPEPFLLFSLHPQVQLQLLEGPLTSLLQLKPLGGPKAPQVRSQSMERPIEYQFGSAQVRSHPKEGLIDHQTALFSRSLF